jgi:hypothetical protein
LGTTATDPGSFTRTRTLKAEAARIALWLVRMGVTETEPADEAAVGALSKPASPAFATANEAVRSAGAASPASRRRIFTLPVIFGLGPPPGKAGSP